MTTYFYESDLPAHLTFGDAVAVDTETMGLIPGRDRLCLVQLSSGDGDAHVVRISRGQRAAPNLTALFENPKVLKIFHFARFDIAMLKQQLGINVAPLYCTKIASKLVRTYTDRHGLKELCREVLGVELSKQQRSSDWGQTAISEEQLAYAASDVLYLHKIKDKLDAMLVREHREDVAQACFDFLPIRADLDLMGWAEQDIFSHS